MQENNLLNDIILLVRGSNLPTNEEIEQMTFEEKEKLENEQYQIIQIFRQQALLDIWQLKNKIEQLLIETVKLREMEMQNQKYSEDNKTESINQENNQKKQEGKNLKPKKKKENQTTKIQKQSAAGDIQKNQEETDFTPKNKPTLRINTKKNEDKSNVNDKPENKIKYLQPNRKTKVRNLVKKNPRLETFNLRIKEKGKNQNSQNNPKYPFSYQQVDTTPKKYASLVSTLNPKYIIDAENQNKKDSVENPKSKSEKNQNSDKKDEKTSNKNKKYDKNAETKDKNVQSKNKKIDTKIHQSKEIKPQQTVKEQKINENKKKQKT